MPRLASQNDELELIFLHCGSGRGGVCPVRGARILLMLLTIFKSNTENVDKFLAGVTVGLKAANAAGHPQDIDTLYWVIIAWSKHQSDDIQTLCKMVTDEL